MTEAEPERTEPNPSEPNLTDSVERSAEPSGRRVLLTGCAVLLFVVGGLVGLGVWLVAAWTKRGSAASPQELRTWEELEGDPAERPGGRLTRTERRQLEADLRQVERELDFARDQLRGALGGEREAWRQRVEELQADQQRIRGRLGG